MFTLVRYALSFSPRATTTLLITAIVLAGVETGLSVTLGKVVDVLPAAVSQGNESVFPALTGWLIVLMVLVLLGSVQPTVLMLATRYLMYRLDKEVDKGISEQLLWPRGIAHLESYHVEYQVQRARGGGNFGVWIGFFVLGRVLSHRLMAIGAAAIVGWVYSWWVGGLLLVSTWLVEWYYGRVSHRETSVWMEETASQRLAEYTFSLGTDRAAKELRLFGAEQWLVGKYVEAWKAAITPVWHARGKGVLTSVGIFGLHAAWVIIAVGLAAKAASEGALSVGEITTVLLAILQVGTSGDPSGVAKVRRGVTSYRAMAILGKLVATEARRSWGNAVVPSGTPAIRFEDVWFKYPESDIYVLRGVDLELRPGEAVALVGVNGAGKSTLVQLLAGLYRSTRGRIMVNGVDLAELSETGLQAWQRRIAPIVQDFIRLPLSVDENVQMGSTYGGNWRSAAEKAGVVSIVERLPEGWATVLDTTVDCGVDLSGGEWQRLALARALHAVEKGADMLVLDEPAAALDVRMESELVERYLEFSAGVSSLVISHRLSIVRKTDHIYVLEDGKVAEDGSHEQLISLDGRYARMFQTQAERYVR